ncbi:hypothetical protein [Pradoshia sp.]|uniref:hypothetical protein n=1 Tax=Pradoshia sp. TaxID=2651281 RepID=UPI003F052A69
MATCILYINSSIKPVVFSPSAIYMNDPSYRITDCSGQPLFQSRIWQQLMNPNRLKAKKNSSPSIETVQIAAAPVKGSSLAKKRVRRFPRSLARLFEQTARQDFLYQQQLSFNRLRALKIQQQSTSPYQVKKEPDHPALPEAASLQTPLPIKNHAISPPQQSSSPEVTVPLEQSELSLEADRQTAPITEEQEITAARVVEEKVTEHTVASGFKTGDRISLSYGSAKIGEGHFILAGSNYLVWEYDGDMRLQYIGDGIHIEKL